MVALKCERRGFLQNWAAPPCDLFEGGGGEAPHNSITPPPSDLFDLVNVEWGCWSNKCVSVACLCMYVCEDGGFST